MAHAKSAIGRVDNLSPQILAICLVIEALTDIQRRVFDCIRDKLVAGRPAPTLREVAAQFGWSSKRAAECHIEALVCKGWLVSEPGKARSLRLVDAAQAIRRAVMEIP